MVAVSSGSGGEHPDPKDQAKMMRDMLGPQAVDQLIRQAITFCWQMLPAERRNSAGVAAEIRRIVDRALKDLKDDAKAFGLADSPAPDRAP
jgi:histone H3/H4